MKTTTEMQLVPITKLVPYVNNARTHSPEQITKLRSSLREFGFINPVIIDRAFNVIAGHGRILAAKEEGITEVPCVFADHLSEAQKKAYIIADNRMAMDAGWDEELLRVEIESLQGMDFDPLLTGFDEKELAELFADDSGSEARDDDFDLTAALEKASFAERGDVWTVGRHRLVCGDATSAEDVALLMDGRKANLIVTDPPYGVSFKSASGLTIQNDSMKDEEFYNFLLSAFKCMAEHLEKGGAAYVFHADTEGLNFRKAFIDAGFHLAGVCIWVKNSLVLGRSDYQWQHEPVLYGFLQNGKHPWYSDRKQTTIWNYDKPKRNANHPTSKPRGVYVGDDLSIWIADTGNLRLATLNADRTDRKAYGKPDSALLENSFTFDVQKLFVANTGYIYVLKGANLIAIDEANNFRGYLGADDVGFSLSRTLIRMFGSKSQIERTVKQEPASYSNFYIGADNMIYGILSNKETAQIRKLNSVGNNTYETKKYGFTLEDKEGKPLHPTMADITVEDNGIITVVDRITGLIYQYDQEGNLLCTFGGIGTVGGLFQIPVSIDHDSEGFLYVLDYNTGSITVFKPTHFIKLIHQAVTLHGEGRYAEALDYWQQALKIDSNYALAHQGVAKVMGKQENWEDALASYYLADDKEGYSEAFAEYRHETFRQHFVPIVLGIAVGALLLVKLLGFLKKKADQWADDVQMGRGL